MKKEYSLNYVNGGIKKSLKLFFVWGRLWLFYKYIERGMDLHFEIIRIEEIETDWRLKLNWLSKGDNSI